MRATRDAQSVLVVDDDEDLREQLVRAFRRRGYEVRGAATVDAAIELAADESPELAVVDLRIGGASGLTVVRDLLRIDPMTRVVVLTGYGSIASATKAMRLGAVDYLTKPADVEDLIAAFAQTERPVLDARELDHDPPSLARAEWEHINRVLEDCGGNITHAAEKLKIHRRSLQRKLRRPPGE
ncbi:MAG: response regulator [Polyangiaceae bacterium]